MSEVDLARHGRRELGAVVVAGAASYALGSLSPAAAAAGCGAWTCAAAARATPGPRTPRARWVCRWACWSGRWTWPRASLRSCSSTSTASRAARSPGIAAVLGHVTSPLLKGRGGKGVATSLGAILAIEPLWAVPVLVGFGATVGADPSGGHRLGRGVRWPCCRRRSSIWRGWAGVGFAAGMSGLVVYRHRRNIRSFVATLRDSGSVDTGGSLPDPERWRRPSWVPRPAVHRSCRTGSGSATCDPSVAWRESHPGPRPRPPAAHRHALAGRTGRRLRCTRQVRSVPVGCSTHWTPASRVRTRAARRRDPGVEGDADGEDGEGRSSPGPWDASGRGGGSAQLMQPRPDAPDTDRSGVADAPACGSGSSRSSW